MSKTSPKGHKHLKISWSALGRFEECKRQNRLVSTGHRSHFQDRRNFLQGTVVDLAMRTLLETAGDRTDPQPGLLHEFVKDHFRIAISKDSGEKGIIKWKGNPEEDKIRILKRCLKAADRLEPWLYENVLPYEYLPEARGVGTIGIPDENDELQRVDLFFATDILLRIEEGNWSILDLKITENEQYTSGKTLGQLTFYAIGLAARLGIPVTDFQKLSFVTPLLREMEHTVYPDAEDFRYMVTRITAYAQSHWAGDYSPKSQPDDECHYRCPVKHACPLFAIPPGKFSMLSVANMRKPDAAEPDPRPDADEDHGLAQAGAGPSPEGSPDGGSAGVPDGEPDQGA